MPSVATEIQVAMVFPVEEANFPWQEMNRLVRPVFLNSFEDISKDDVLREAINGKRIEISFHPDCVEVTFGVRPANAGHIPFLISEICNHAKFDQSDLNHELDLNQFYRSSVHDVAFWGPEIRFKKVDAPALSRWLSGALNGPGQVFVSGPPEIAPLKNEIDSDFTAHRAMLSLDRAIQFTSADEASNTSDAKVISSTRQLHAPSTDELNAQLLSLFAFGAGKGSLLFQVLRQKLALSYDQRAVLEGAASGFRVRLFAIGDRATSADDISSANKLLSEGIDHLTSDDLNHALMLADFQLHHTNGLNPLTGLGFSADSELSLRAYWQLKLGTEFSPEALLSGLKAVTLDQLKSAMKQCLPLVQEPGS